MKSSGHTIIEYAICLSLLGVLGLGSLTLMGGNISDLLGTFTSTKTVAKTDQLFSLIDANTNVLGSNPNPAASLGVASAAPGANSTLQLKLDPTTGQVVITNATGGSKNTTSVDGSTTMSLLAQQLSKLANVTMANGQPMPSTIRQQILQLMKDGVSLTQATNTSSSLFGKFSAVNRANQGKNSGLQKYPPPVVSALGTNLNSGMQFKDDYYSLMYALNNLAKRDSTVNNTLITPISELAGGISSISYNNMGRNLASNFNINAANTSSLLKVYQDNPLIQQSIPVSSIIQTALLPPAQRETITQQQFTSLAQSTVVGTPPTANGTVRIALGGYTGCTHSSASMANTVPTGSGVQVSTTVRITSTGIQASVTTAAP